MPETDFFENSSFTPPNYYGNYQNIDKDKVDVIKTKEEDISILNSENHSCKEEKLIKVENDKIDVDNSFKKEPIKIDVDNSFKREPIFLLNNKPAEDLILPPEQSTKDDCDIEEKNPFV